MCLNLYQLKGSWQMTERLKELERRPDEELSQDEANTIFDLDFNLDASARATEPQTLAPCSTRPTCLRRRVKHEYTSSDEEDSQSLIQSVVPNIHQTTATRSQRASKTAAMTNTKMDCIRIEEDDEQESSESEINSDDDSDQLTE